MPTKTEQSDLLMALFGRHGEAPMPVLAARSPADCYYAAIEAMRIAVKWMTPVLLLTDGYLGFGSEPFRIPEEGEIKPFEVKYQTKPNYNGQYMPYLRDEKLIRPWAIPGTAGLEHRIGGIEKDYLTGNVSYAPTNHEQMVRVRARKVAGIAQEIPPTAVHGPASGDLLVLGWGSTFGSIREAVNNAQAKGLAVSHVHLRYLNPLPPDLGDILARFKKVLIPEMNLGQLVRIIRAEYLVDAVGLNKIQGLPFKASEIGNKIQRMLEA